MALAAPILVWSWWRIAGPRARLGGPGPPLAGPRGGRRAVRRVPAAAGALQRRPLRLAHRVRSQLPTHVAQQRTRGRLLLVGPRRARPLVLPPPAAALGPRLPVHHPAPRLPRHPAWGFYVEPVAGILVVIAPARDARGGAGDGLARPGTARAGAWPEVSAVLVAVAVLLPSRFAPVLRGGDRAVRGGLPDAAPHSGDRGWLWLASACVAGGWPGRRAGPWRGGDRVLASWPTSPSAWWDTATGSGPRSPRRTSGSSAPSAGSRPSPRCRASPDCSRSGPRWGCRATAVSARGAGSGVVDLRATFVANPDLPPGSVVALNVTGRTASARRFRLPPPRWRRLRGLRRAAADERIADPVGWAAPRGAGRVWCRRRVRGLEPHVVRWTPR